MKNENLVWHYTTEKNARSIVFDGEIKLATTRLHNGELPVVWFSANQFYEQTATCIVPSENNRLATWDEMKRARLFRFGLHANQLIHWPQLISAANIASEMVLYLENDGRGRGANPLDWYGNLAPVSLASVVIVERLTPEELWVKCSD